MNTADNRSLTFVMCENEKYYYYATRIRNSQSILHAFPDNAIHVNACRTKKEAQEIVTYWNECAKRNGNYAFAEPLF